MPARVEPEPDEAVELLLHVHGRPVQVGLLGCGQVQDHCPGGPAGSVTRVQAGPPKALIQSSGGSASPARPSRKKYRARSGDPGPAARAARNHACSAEVWLATRA